MATELDPRWRLGDTIEYTDRQGNLPDHRLPVGYLVREGISLDNEKEIGLRVEDYLRDHFYDTRNLYVSWKYSLEGFIDVYVTEANV